MAGGSLRRRQDCSSWRKRKGEVGWRNEGEGEGEEEEEKKNGRDVEADGGIFIISGRPLPTKENQLFISIPTDTRDIKLWMCRLACQSGATRESWHESWQGRGVTSSRVRNSIDNATIASRGNASFARCWTMVRSKTLDDGAPGRANLVPSVGPGRG